MKGIRYLCYDGKCERFREMRIILQNFEIDIYMYTFINKKYQILEE